MPPIDPERELPATDYPLPPIAQEPIPDSIYPAGWPIGDSDASGTDYEVQELLHRPHAFALMHGDNGAKIAYGQLHWRVDCFTMEFMQDLIEVTVDNHPHWSQQLAAHVHDYNHAPTGDVDTYAGSVVAHTHAGSTAHGDHTHELIYRYALNHTVKLPTITYCSRSSQEAIGNINVEVPTLGSADGEGMDATIPNIYHELGGYGDVYLVWIVDIEDAGSEVQDCWVQVGEPDGSQISAITIGHAATNRRNSDVPHYGTGEPESGDDTGVFKMLLGTVNLNEQIIQKVSSDVNGTTTVMDREKVTAVNTLVGLQEYTAP